MNTRGAIADKEQIRGVYKASELGPVAQQVVALRPELRSLFRRGVLERGTSVSIRKDLGAMSLLVQLLAYPLAEGKWVAMVGFTEYGALVLEEERLRVSRQLGEQDAAEPKSDSLERLVLIPDPGTADGEVVSSALETMDVVAINGSGLGLRRGAAKRLLARLRTSSAVLIVLGSLSESTDVQCRVVEQSWSGLGKGRGRLRSQELRVQSLVRRDPGLRECTVKVGG